jgi:cation/acetate symporter
LTYGKLLQINNTKALEITRDAKEKETRALWKKEADEAQAKIKAGGLDEDTVDKLKAQASLATKQATAPAVSDDAKIGRYLTVPSGVGMWNFLALTFCLMVGTAGLPHILTRYYTTPSVKEARTSVAWSLLFIFLLYFTAPAYAAFARFVIYTKLVGTHIAELPRWVTLWAPAGLFEVVDKLGNGIVEWADFVVKSTDFVVLAMPEIAGLPFVITGLVMAGGLAAALSTADGLLLTIANAFSHDLYYNVLDPKASLTKRLTITKILLVVTALIAAWVATFRVAIIVELVAWAFSLAAASFFPALVMGIWWKRANKAGACAGMIAGLAVTTYYMIGSRFYGVSWFGTQTIASAVFGLPIGFITIWIVSLLTEAPPQPVQDLVASVRYPKTGQAFTGDPLGRGLPAGAR